MSAQKGQKRSLDPSGITGGYELPNVGAGNQILVLWKSIKCWLIFLVSNFILIVNPVKIS